MLKLMQPSPSLPSEHPLLCYQYGDSDKWTSVETEVFHQSLMKYDKDFANISKEVSTYRIYPIIYDFIVNYINFVDLLIPFVNRLAQRQ